jgi:hypothetical protein
LLHLNGSHSQQQTFLVLEEQHMSDRATVFDILDHAEINAENASKVQTFSRKKLFSILESAAASIPEFTHTPSSTFTFAANDSLSGLPAPFDNRSARLKSADDLARFAALYADAILVRDPLHQYFNQEDAVDSNGRRIIVKPALTQSMLNKDLKQSITTDFEVLLKLRPLFDAGIAHFVKPQIDACPVCLHRVVAVDKAAGVELPFQVTEWHERVVRMVEYLERAYVEQGMILGHRHGDHAHAIIGSPPGMMEYDNFQRNADLDGIILPDDQPHPLTLEQVRASSILSPEVERVVSDVFNQLSFATTHRARPITNRRIDADLARAALATVEEPLGARAFDALAHPVEFIHNVSIESLCLLRRREPEAFEVYRDAVTLALKQAGKEDEGKMRQAVNDIIRPELNRIAQKLRTSRKALGLSLATDVAVTAGAASIALLSGMLSSSFEIPAGLAEVGAAIGGWSGIKGIVSKAPQLFGPNKEVMENPYYFLWKARENC